MTDTRTAVVTGAGRGIAAGIAKRLAADGFAVAVVDIDEAGSARVVEEIRTTGGRALAIKLDVGNERAVTAGVAQVTTELGPPAVLVNSAGILQDHILFAMSEHELDEVVELNRCGAHLMTRAVQDHMIVMGWGRIINLFSTLATGEAKADERSAQEGLLETTRRLATELGGSGVTVNAIAPGFIETDLTAATAKWLGLRFERHKPRAAQGRSARAGVPEDIAHAVSFFVSEGAGFVSGQVLQVSGVPAA